MVVLRSRSLGPCLGAALALLVTGSALGAQRRPESSATPPAPPAAPATVVATLVRSDAKVSAVAVQWTRVAGALYYDVGFSVPGSGWMRGARASAPDTTLLLEVPPRAEWVVFRVVASHRGGSSMPRLSDTVRVRRAPRPDPAVCASDPRTPGCPPGGTGGATGTGGTGAPGGAGGAGAPGGTTSADPAGCVGSSSGLYVCAGEFVAWDAARAATAQATAYCPTGYRIASGGHEGDVPNGTVATSRPAGSAADSWTVVVSRIGGAGAPPTSGPTGRFRAVALCTRAS